MPFQFLCRGVGWFLQISTHGRCHVGRVPERNFCIKTLLPKPRPPLPACHRHFRNCTGCNVVCSRGCYWFRSYYMASTTLFAVVARCSCGIALEGRFPCLGAYTISFWWLETVEGQIQNVSRKVQSSTETKRITGWPIAGRILQRPFCPHAVQ